jgi:hypothetical protein
VHAGAYEIGMEYLVRGDAAAAQEHLEEAAAGGDREAMLWLGVVLAEAGDAGGAKREWARAGEEYVRRYVLLGKEGLGQTAWEDAFREVAGLAWDEYRRAVTVVYEAEDLTQQVGRGKDEREASGGEAILYDGERDGEGYLAFGPYDRYGEGWYEARYRVRAEGYARGARCGRVDVARRKGEEVAGADLVAGRNARDEYADVVLGYRHEDARDRLEFRVWAGGGGRLRIDRVEVRPDMRAVMRARAARIRAARAAAGGG